MLSKEDNELLTRTGPGTPMGELFRRFWLPALLPSELPAPDCDPIRFRILGQDLIAADQTFHDGVADILFSRRPFSDFDQLVTEWRTSAGDTIRKELLDEISASK
jgi:phthalate 4,5-dioxygenase oxygenase subunit